MPDSCTVFLRARCCRRSQAQEQGPVVCPSPSDQEQAPVVCLAESAVVCLAAQADRRALEGARLARHSGRHRGGEETGAVDSFGSVLETHRRPKATYQSGTARFTALQAKHTQHAKGRLSDRGSIEPESEAKRCRRRRRARTLSGGPGRGRCLSSRIVEGPARGQHEARQHRYQKQLPETT